MFYSQIDNFPRVKTVETTNLQWGECIKMEFSLYNVTYMLVFTSMLTQVYEKKRMLWMFPNASK